MTFGKCKVAFQQTNKSFEHVTECKQYKQLLECLKCFLIDPSTFFEFFKAKKKKKILQPDIINFKKLSTLDCS